MKILIHSNAPWVGTGYGVQTRLLLPRLQEDGHEVVVSAISGLTGGEIEWTGREVWDASRPVRVLPAGQYGFGVDTLPAYIRDEKPDLVLTIMDCRMLGPIAEQLRGAPLACWVPADTSPLSRPEAAFLRASGAKPLAMTRWGEKQLREAGFEYTLYIPHGVDTDMYNLDSDELQEDARERLGVPVDAYVIGMVAANSDAIRKGFPEQFEAFRRLRATNAKAHLVVHTIANASGGWNLEELAQDLGIENDVSFSRPLPQVTGRIDDAHMSSLYRSFDVLSQCSYGEGFGVPMIEAMASGTPVIATDAGAMFEIAGSVGFMVGSSPFWNPVHKSWWARPDIDGIVSGYRHYGALRGKQAFYDLQRRARSRGCEYDIDVIYRHAWRPFLTDWEAVRHRSHVARTHPHLLSAEDKATLRADAQQYPGQLVFDEPRIAELRAAGLSEESAVAMSGEGEIEAAWDRAERAVEANG